MGMGAKFKDAQLVGLPVQIVIGKELPKLEWSLRASEDSAVLSFEDAVNATTRALAKEE